MHDFFVCLKKRKKEHYLIHTEINLLHSLGCLAYD